MFGLQQPRHTSTLLDHPMGSGHSGEREGLSKREWAEMMTALVVAALLTAQLVGSGKARQSNAIAEAKGAMGRLGAGSPIYTRNPVRS
jgi:hypothetical protein